MSDQKAETQAEIDPIRDLEKPKGLPRFRINWFTFVLVIALTSVLVLIGLALLGPTATNIYSSVEFVL